MLRTILRFVSGLVGFCLIWPGFWAIILLINDYSIPRSAADPLFDRIALWIMPLAIWAASFSLLRFAVKEPK